MCDDSSGKNWTQENHIVSWENSRCCVSSRCEKIQSLRSRFSCSVARVADEGSRESWTRSGQVFHIKNTASRGLLPLNESERRSRAKKKDFKFFYVRWESTAEWIFDRFVFLREKIKNNYRRVAENTFRIAVVRFHCNHRFTSQTRRPHVGSKFFTIFQLIAVIKSSYIYRVLRITKQIYASSAASSLISWDSFEIQVVAIKALLCVRHEKVITAKESPQSPQHNNDDCLLCWFMAVYDFYLYHCSKICCRALCDAKDDARGASQQVKVCLPTSDVGQQLSFTSDCDLQSDANDERRQRWSKDAAASHRRDNHDTESPAKEQQHEFIDNARRSAASHWRHRRSASSAICNHYWWTCNRHGLAAHYLSRQQ